MHNPGTSVGGVMSNEGLGTWLDRRRARFAGRTALVRDSEHITYDQFAEQVDWLAAGFNRLGVAAGDRIAYLGDNHPSFLQVLFAAGKLGAVFVPLNTRHAAPEVAFALADSGACVLVHADLMSDLAKTASSEADIGCRVVVPTDHEAEPDGDIDDGRGTDVVRFTELLADARDRSGEHQATGMAENEPIHAPVSLEDAAMILYTSGTTGRPKGAVLTHGNITWNCLNVLTDLDISSDEVALMISPMFHVASLDMGVLPTLLKGGTVILEPQFDAGRALELIEARRATFISGVPTTYKMLCEHADWNRRDISSLRHLTCGGSPVSRRVRASYERRGLAFTNGYGMTETAPGVTFLPADQSEAKSGSAGLPHFFTDIRIVGPDGDDVVAGDTGEIVVKGPNVIPRYWGRPDATRDSFDSGGWFRSGDLGYRDADGFLYVSDRLKDMIISGGENIYPAEVEELIIELDGVADVAVIGVPDPTWGEVPRAIVTRSEGSDLDTGEVIAHLTGRLAGYKIPKSVVVLDVMPRTASGKIRKAELRQHYSQ